MTRRILASGIAACVMAAGLAACDDPKPGLKDEVRVAKVDDCKAAIGRFAPTDTKKNQLCECVTGKLATQGLSVSDLTGPKRDRAMEQLHWCGVQIGIFSKSGFGAPTASSSDAATSEASVEPDEDASEAASDTPEADASVGE